MCQGRPDATARLILVARTFAPPAQATQLETEPASCKSGRAASRSDGGGGTTQSPRHHSSTLDQYYFDLVRYLLQLLLSSQTCHAFCLVLEKRTFVLKLLPQGAFFLKPG